MVSNYAHSHIGLTVRRIGHFAGVCMSRKLLDYGNGAAEHVSVVVRLFALNGHAEPLKAHSGVHVSGRKFVKRTVGFAVELHKHVVPYFDNLRMVGVHQIAARRLSHFFG